VRLFVISLKNAIQSRFSGTSALRHSIRRTLHFLFVTCFLLWYKLPLTVEKRSFGSWVKSQLLHSSQKTQVLKPTPYKFIPKSQIPRLFHRIF